MRKITILLFTMTVGLLSVSTPLLAHHGTAVFDAKKILTMKGTVTEWDWFNPHCLLQFDVKNETGQVVHWTAETQNPANMVYKGWRKTSFKAGDEITVTLIPTKNGQPFGQIKQVVLANGTTLEAAGTASESSDSTNGPKTENYPK
jgi:hypothetical protein